MDETPLRGYPYPECDPPYVKDAADLPLDLYLLASAIDTDVGALATAVTEAVNPAACRIQNTAPPAVALPSGSAVQFNATLLDDTPPMADLALDRIVLNSDGLWLATAGYTATVSAAASAFTLSLALNGSVFHSMTHHPGGIFGINTVTSAMFLGSAGDALNALTFFASGTATMTAAQLSVVRVVAL